MWIESGLTWAYSLMQRLDHSYKMRTSDCPSLKRKPSEYLREKVWWTTQPMEETESPTRLAETIEWMGWDRLIQPLDAGSYDVVLTNPAGSLTSSRTCATKHSTARTAH
jgi:hypothetical protein